MDAGLIVLLVFGVLKFRQDWKAFDPTHDVSAIQPTPQAFTALPVVPSGNAAGSGDWTEIPTKNPFSFDRNDIDIVVAEAPPKPVGPKPVLFGIMVIGTDKTAFVAPGGGNRNSRPMKVGEVVDGWTIVEIGTKTIEVESNGNRQAVILNDPTAQISRAIDRTSAPVTGGSSTTVIQPNGQTSGTNITERSSPAPDRGQPAPPPGQPTGRYEDTPFGIKRWVPGPPPKP